MCCMELEDRKRRIRGDLGHMYITIPRGLRGVSVGSESPPHSWHEKPYQLLASASCRSKATRVQWWTADSVCKYVHMVYHLDGNFLSCPLALGSVHTGKPSSSYQVPYYVLLCTRTHTITVCDSNWCVYTLSGMVWWTHAHSTNCKEEIFSSYIDAVAIVSPHHALVTTSTGLD